jgi:signal transduction histidine kinase
MTGRRVAWAMWAVVMVMLVANIVLATMNGTLAEDVVFVVMAILAGVGSGTVGALIVSRQGRNAIGWLFLGIAASLMLTILVEEYVTYGLLTSPGSLPGTTFFLWLSNWVVLPWLVAIPVVFLLFPTGRVPSPRWRWLLWAIVVGAALAIGGWIVKPGTISPQRGIAIQNPTGIDALDGVAGGVIAAGGIILGPAALASVVALFIRFRRAEAVERLQIKWLAYVALLAGILAVATFVSGITLGDDQSSTLNDVLFTMTLATLTVGIPVASGLAILRYRLYDIDLVVNKAVVYGVLAVFITLVYVGIVVGVGALVGSQGNVLLSILATAVVALAFQPVRQWARHLANRVVYGKRATPYEVLSELARGVGGSYAADDALPRVASIIGLGTGAARAEVWLRVGGELRRDAMWPAGDAGRITVPIEDGLPSISGADRVLPVEDRGELLGALAVSMPRGETVVPATDKLLQDVASQAGLILRNVRLIEELRASRQRLVTAQDEERRRLERNIHDGAQQQLVALSVKMRLLKALNEKDPGKANELVDQLQSDSQDALDTLRDLARGIYPPLLADQGLGAALQAQARKAAVPVEVEQDGIGRYPQDAEATAYFCVLEALQNIAKYAGPSRAVVRLDESDGHLVFAVSDDGAGFDVERTPRGSGLQNMADRVEAVGGSIDITSAPGRGTTVIGRIPVAPVGS